MTVAEATAASWEYFISILSQGGFLDTTASTYANDVLDVPNLTYFLPNSAEALAAFEVLFKNSTSAETESIFEYHIVPNFDGYSTLLQNGMSLKTLQGTNITITIQDGETYVNAAQIIATNYMVANGVVHVIDT